MSVATTGIRKRNGMTVGTGGLQRHRMRMVSGTGSFCGKCPVAVVGPCTIRVRTIRRAIAGTYIMRMTSSRRSRPCVCVTAARRNASVVIVTGHFSNRHTLSYSTPNVGSQIRLDNGVGRAASGFIYGNVVRMRTCAVYC